MIYRKTKQFITGFLIAALIFEQFALIIDVAQAQSLPSYNGDSPQSPAGSTYQSEGLSAPLNMFQPDLFTGRSGTSIPIKIPPIRGNINFNLALGYSSGGGNSALGVGWNVGTGAIQYDTKNGVPDYTNPRGPFIIGIPEVSGNIIFDPSTNQFRSELDYDSLIIYKLTNSWKAVDKNGTSYYFGQVTDTRISNPNNGSQIFAWYLDKIEDVNGNYLDIRYYNYGNQLYPKIIRYTGSSGETPKFGIVFKYSDLPKSELIYRSGFAITPSKKIDYIVTMYNQNGMDNSLTGTNITQYLFSYQENSTQRQLLDKIEIKGWAPDGTNSTLPPINFDYTQEYKGWVSSTQTLPTMMVQWDDGWSTYFDQGMRFADINGDGLIDIIQSQRYGKNCDSCPTCACPGPNVPITTIANVWLNTPTGWQKSTEWSNSLANIDYPIARNDLDPAETGGTSYDGGTRLADVNNDGYIDIIHSRYNKMFEVETKTWINNKINGWSLSADWKMPAPFISWKTFDNVPYGDQGTRLADLNADGYPDVIQAIDDNLSGNNIRKVWLNNKSSGWSYSPSFSSMIPAAFAYHRGRSSSSSQYGFEVIDINGDGLNDFFQTNCQGTCKNYLNTGTDWEQNLYYARPTNMTGDIRYGDLNGDGLLDIIQLKQGDNKVYLNTGGPEGATAWKEDGTWSAGIPSGIFSNSQGTNHAMGLEIVDINGDNKADFVKAFQDPWNNSIASWRSAQDGPENVLKSVLNGIGGKTDISYSYYSQRGTNLPLPIPIVTSSTTSDGYGHNYSSDFTYQGGKFDRTEKEFRGFEIAKVTDRAFGNSTETRFYQTNPLKGRQVYSITKDSTTAYSTRQDFTWGYSNINNIYQIHLSDQTTTYTDSSGSKSTKVGYTYNSNNSPTSVISYGDTQTTGDEKTVKTEYTQNTSLRILDKPKYTWSEDYTGKKVAEKWIYYDENNDFNASPVRGLPTKEELWLDGGNNPKVTTTYDSYGNTISVTDAQGNTSTTIYDPCVHIFPIEATNALGYKTYNTYELERGLLLESKDANNLVSKVKYDTLARKTEEYRPGDDNVPSVKYEYDMSSAGVKHVFKLTKLPQGGYFYTGTFYDGLGRTLYTKIQRPYDETQDIITRRVEYDSKGRVNVQYPAYFTNYDSYADFPELPSKAISARTVTEYDWMDRPIKVTVAQNTNEERVSKTNYLGWTTESLGKNNQGNYDYKSRYYYNAYKQLSKVEELNANGSTYSTTTYKYDPNSSLAQVEDNDKNKTIIAYDSLGRKKFMTDPDMGTWEYFYDPNGNLTEQIDAKSQTVEMQYDNLNRLTLKNTKDSQDITQSTTNYYYDTYQQGASCRVANDYTTTSYGSLCATDDGTTKTMFWFDELGREVKNQKLLDGQTYEIKKEYDSLDRLTKVIQPENPNTGQKDEIYYTYYNIGAIKTISGKEKVDNKEIIQPYVTNIEYNEQGQKTQINYGNKTYSKYLYDDITSLLKKLETVDSSGIRKLQDLNYTFDKAGNVSEIKDNLDNLRTQSFEYDNLNRLTKASQAQIGGYGTINYQYDTIGNLTKKNNTEYKYGENRDGPHALTSQVDSGQTSSYDYDANGNMTNRDGDALVYDSENHLTQAQYTDNSPKITIELKKGWNFFSLPFDPDNKAISIVLSQLDLKEGSETIGDYDQISQWNPDTQTYEHYANLGGDKFVTLEYGRGYAINILKDSVTLTLEDNIKVQTTSKTLKKGWNVIGSDSSKNLTKEEFLAKFGNSSGIQIFRYNAKTYAWEFCGREFSDIEPGKGYAVYAGNDTTRTLKDSNTSAKGTTQFVYDENGGRIKKIDGDKTNTYLGPSFELEKNGINTTVVESIFEGDNRIVSSNDNVDYWYHQNHLGSTDVMTDATGQDARTRVEYYPYGQTYKQTGDTDLTKYLYTGKELDEGTDLYYYGARYYDPGLQRFTQADIIVPSPSDPQSFNRYAYAANNPIIYNDPSGHYWWVLPMFVAFYQAMQANNHGGDFGTVFLNSMLMSAANYYIINPIIGAVFNEVFGLQGVANASDSSRAIREGLNHDIWRDREAYSSFSTNSYDVLSGGSGGLIASNNLNGIGIGWSKNNMSSDLNVKIIWAQIYREEGKTDLENIMVDIITHDKEFKGVVDGIIERIWEGSQGIIGQAIENPEGLKTIESAGNFLIKSAIGTTTNYSVKQLAISSFLANPSFAAAALYRLIGPLGVAAFCVETFGKHIIDVWSKNNIRNIIEEAIIFGSP